jgi:hypothetical protein
MKGFVFIFEDFFTFEEHTEVEFIELYHEAPRFREEINVEDITRVNLQYAIETTFKQVIRVDKIIKQFHPAFTLQCMKVPAHDITYQLK